ncbi:MAG TPA: universal stress protein [Candidatus Methylomirabilis sp.]|nr:universal stress protein [Candidatus Methylomirabilis sp.]
MADYSNSRGTTACEAREAQANGQKALPSLFSRLLVPTDFSAVATRSLQYAQVLAQRYGSQIYLTHVLPEETVAAHVSRSSRHPDERLRLAAQGQMDRLLRRLPPGAMPCNASIEAGRLWCVIEGQIYRYGIDLIILGTRGVRPKPEPFLGSGAEQIFRHAPCPVLTIGPAALEKNIADPVFSKVLFVTDFGASAEKAGGYAASFARTFGASVTSLHIVENPRASSPAALNHLRQIHIQRMTHSVHENHWADCHPHFIIRFGNAAEETLAASREMQAHLIVMGARTTPQWAGHIPLSTAYNVVAKAACPVLTIRNA